MKYKVGDKVKIRNDLVEYKQYGHYTFVPYMNKFKGEQTIKKVYYDGYAIEADAHDFKWSDEMFEDIKEDKMNTLQINMNNLSEEERNTLLSLIEKANKPKNKVWEPEKDETYYYSYSDGSIEEATWDNINVDKNRYAIGNCFKTREEAEFALEKQKVITELKRYAIEHNEGEIDWYVRGTCKYYIQYDYVNNKLNISHTRYFKNNNSSMYFTSEKIAEAAIEAISEERIKKYCFEVND